MPVFKTCGVNRSATPPCVGKGRRNLGRRAELAKPSAAANPGIVVWRRPWLARPHLTSMRARTRYRGPWQGRRQAQPWILASGRENDSFEGCTARAPSRSPSSARRFVRPRRRGYTGGRSDGKPRRSEEHTSELQSLMRPSYAVFRLEKKRVAEH